MNDFVDKFALADLPLVVNDYTWARGWANLSLRKLDRFLVSSEWEEKYASSSNCSLPNTCSDPCPILLDYVTVILGPRPFQFELMWLEDGTLLPLLKELW